MHTRAVPGYMVIALALTVSWCQVSKRMPQCHCNKYRHWLWQTAAQKSHQEACKSYENYCLKHHGSAKHAKNCRQRTINMM